MHFIENEDMRKRGDISIVKKKKKKKKIFFFANAMQCNGLDRLGGKGSTVAPVTNRHWGSQLPHSEG